MRKPIRAVSLFDGISCFRVALDKEKIPVEVYYACEIDKYAIQVSQKNYPDIKQMGSVTDFGFRLADIDLLVGGSPCQDLSIAGKREGLKGKKSGLFYEYVRILNEVKPKYFILENVNSMSKEARDTITQELFGIEPVMINASLVSAQNRKRLFWVGKWNGHTYEKVEIPQPEDKGILLKDIIHETRGETFDLEKYIVKGNHLTWITDEERLKKKRTNINGDKSITMMARQYASWNGQYLSVRLGKFNKGGQGDRIYSTDGKSCALSALGGGRGAKTGLYCISSKQAHKTILEDKSTTLTAAMGMGGGHTPMITEDFETIRKLTPIECERLQGLPDNYTDGISNSQRYKCLGNAFNADVIAHILKFL